MKKFEKLCKRLCVSAIVILIVLFFLFYHELVPVRILLFFFLSGLAVFGVWEYGQMLRVKQYTVEKGILEVGAFLTVSSFVLASFNQTYFLSPFIVLYLLVLLFFILSFKTQKNPLTFIAQQTFAIIYIAWPLGLLFPLIYSTSFNGPLWVLYLLIVTKIFDVAAYFGGKLFGKRKLASKISPNKTIEGAIIGLFFSIVASLCFSYLSQSGLIPFTLNYQSGIVLGAILGAIGQMGDLSESLFKRDAKIKDSNTLPGLGGVLDMVDSLLFTIPLLYFVLYQRVVG